MFRLSSEYLRKNLLRNIYFYLWVCAHVSVYVCNANTGGDQKRVSATLELKLDSFRPPDMGARNGT